MDISELQFSVSATDTIRAVMQLFDHRQQRVDGPNAKLAAEQLSNAQPTMHSDVLGAVVNLTQQMSSSNLRYLEQIASNSLGWMKAHASFQAVQGDGSFWIVESEAAPVLEEGARERAISIVENASGISKVEVAEIFIAAYVRSLSKSKDNAERLRFTEYEYRLGFAASKIEAVWALDREREQQERQSEGAAEEISDIFVRKAAEIEQQLSTLNEKVAQETTAARLATEKSASLEEALIDAERRVDAKTAEFEGKFVDAEDKAEAFMEAARPRRGRR